MEGEPETLNEKIEQGQQEPAQPEQQQKYVAMGIKVSPALAAWLRTKKPLEGGIQRYLEELLTKAKEAEEKATAI